MEQVIQIRKNKNTEDQMMVKTSLMYKMKSIIQKVNRRGTEEQMTKVNDNRSRGGQNQYNETSRKTLSRGLSEH